jgi:hypothetical protein
VAPGHAGGLQKRSLASSSASRADRSFNFGRGQYALVGQLESAAGLYARQQLRLILRKKLGLELNP